MNMIIVLCIPFIGTVLGSAMVFFMKEKLTDRLEKSLLGFAAGVMIAASVWSLLIPSIEMSKPLAIPEWVPASIGFLLGICFLLFLDVLIPHLHVKSEQPEGVNSVTKKLSKTVMLLLAVTLHNIPEGMAVGVAYAGTLINSSGISFMSSIALAIGIAIQNFPEGAIISMPLRNAGMGKTKAFIAGMLSGIVEPLGGMATILLAGIIKTMLPYFLSFAAGAMIYVVVEELIPESQNGEHSNIGTIGVAVGFVIMMILDNALG